MNSTITYSNSIKSGFIKVVLITALILLVPLIAMQFSNEVNWQKGDFVVMGLLCMFAGSALVFALQVKSKKRIIIACAIVTMFIYIWAELAVGIFTNLGS